MDLAEQRRINSLTYYHPLRIKIEEADGTYRVCERVLLLSFKGISTSFILEYVDIVIGTSEVIPFIYILGFSAYVCALQNQCQFCHHGMLFEAHFIKYLFLKSIFGS